MNNQNPTNGELAVLIHSVKEIMETKFTETHHKLDEFNGAIKENSEHRIRQSTINKIIGTIVVFLAFPIIVLILKVFL